MRNEESQFIDPEFVINKDFFQGIKEMVICVICQGIIVEPTQCVSCENTFCKNCISNWIDKSSTCPFKCKSFITKDASRTIKNLLDKINLKCPNNCSTTDEFLYESLLKHFKNCEKLKVKCVSCNSFVFKYNIIESEDIIKLKKDLKNMEEENLKLHVRNSELEEQLNMLKDNNKHVVSNNSTSNASDCYSNTSKNINCFPFNCKEKYRDKQMGLIDKCEHFKGNYKPIFLCCEKAFPCYICHNIIQDHPYEFSNKVVCLLCNNIYSGLKCDECQVYQIYKEK